MNSHIKIILGSLILASIIVVMNGIIHYFLVDEFFNLFNTRSFILFIIVFLGSITTIGGSTEKS